MRLMIELSLHYKDKFKTRLNLSDSLALPVKTGQLFKIITTSVYGAKITHI